MPTYTAPLEDMMFLYEKLRNNKNYNEIEKYKDITDGLYIKNELLLPKKFELKEAEEYCDKLSASRNFDWRKIWNWNV